MKLSLPQIFGILCLIVIALIGLNEVFNWL
jgi:hypothetical protein